MTLGEHVAALDAHVEGLQEQMREIKEQFEGHRAQNNTEHMAVRRALENVRVKQAYYSAAIAAVIIVWDFLSSSGTISLENLIQGK